MRYNETDQTDERILMAPATAQIDYLAGLRDEELAGLYRDAMHFIFHLERFAHGHTGVPILPPYFGDGRPLRTEGELRRETTAWLARYREHIAAYRQYLTGDELDHLQRRYLLMYNAQLRGLLAQLGERFTA